MREALFSMLGPLDGERVLDAFAGSGALGLEALSRGAASVTFVEQDARAAHVIARNIAELGLSGDEAQVVQAPLVERRSAPHASAAMPYDLVFLDPPYRHAPALGAELAERCWRRCWPRGARVVTESDRRAPLDLPLPVDTRTPLRRHPDPHPPGMSTDDPRIAVCPGTYDPITRGHIDVITRTSALYDEVIVAVVNHPVRKGKTLFDTEERLALIEDAIAAPANVRAQAFETLIVDFARAVGARSIVKGLRAISDFEYEAEMNQLNRLQAPDVESVYLMASPQYSFLSSSGIKELAIFDGNIDELVTPLVARRLKEELAR